jgi:hypothetical protein
LTLLASKFGWFESLFSQVFCDFLFFLDLISSAVNGSANGLIGTITELETWLIL